MSEVEGGCVGVGGAGWRGPGEGGDQLVFLDLVPAVAGDPLWAVVGGGFLEGEVDAAVVGPVEFGGMAEDDVAAGREDRVERVASGVCGHCDQLFKTVVGEVINQSSGVNVVGILEVKIQVAKEKVVCRGKGLDADYVGDVVAELRSGPGGL
ncbi:hypothetical protein NDU88_003495 [Pleurodeles waltl]|uniref:Uncharacterized protein n=1 Tax=Pleurodeles waltl TaxID=8319 RepID=A0AAV7SEM6_PLEWA|nr:hypothetical protein NDU88_003495 [Pleurodeles waltl]